MAKPTYYQLPNNPLNPGRVDGAAVLWSLLSIPLICWLSTQSVALYCYQSPQLGMPWLHFLGYAVYPPYAALVWMFRFGFDFHHNTVSPIPVAGGIACVSSLLVSAAVRITLVSRHRQQSLNQDLHGSARWADEKDVRQSGKYGQSSGLFIGGWEEKPGFIRYLRDPSDGHCIGFAPTGSGKTAGMALPNLLSNEDASMIVLDPKSQLYALSSGYRARTGSNVYRFSPASLKSARFNIFSEIRVGTPRDYADANNIALMHCHVPGEATSDSHWDDIAANLCTGLILHEAYKAHLDGRCTTGADITEALTPSQGTFLEKLEEMAIFQHDPVGQYGWKFQDGSHTRTHPVVRAAANAMINRVENGEPNKEFSGALGNAEKRFAFYRDELIRQATSGSDFHIDDLVNHHNPTTLYICNPLSDQTRLLPLTRVIITMSFNRLTEDTRIETPNRNQLVWILDEFPTLKQIDVISERMPLARDFGMKFFLIAQGIGQIAGVFPDDHQTIINNCDVWSVYGPNDRDTSVLISEKTGQSTVAHLAQTFSGGNYDPASKGITQHISWSERALMTPDEVRRLRSPLKNGHIVTEPGDMLLFVRGQRPVFGRQMFYFLDPVFLERSKIPSVTEWVTLQ